MTSRNCRFCNTPLTHDFCDLGMSPLSNSYLKSEDLNKMEEFYPLHVFVCEQCFLVQLEEFKSPERIFSEYSYFSSYSESWLKHVKTYVEKMIERFEFNEQHQVIEIASNDGYLLQYFKNNNIPILGIEPAKNVARIAMQTGIQTITEFFGVKTSRQLVKNNIQADLLIGNNVLAHVPDINDFVAAMELLLKPHGIITMEFPHLVQLIEQNQFDTIYHEHFSYLSFSVVEMIFAKHNLTIFDVEELTTHGGSLRIFAKHGNDNTKNISSNVERLRNIEAKKGFDEIETYLRYAGHIHEAKRSILDFFITQKQAGKMIVGYGAPAKGNTLLNYCGIRSDFIAYTVDRNPHKQGKFLPGIHVRINHPDKIKESKPDYVVILPWNLKDEIIIQLDYIREWGGQFVTLIPEVKVYT